MLRMVSYPHRPQSGHIMCYLNRTYHVLPTILRPVLDESGKPPAVWSLYLSCDSVATSRLSSESGRGAVGTMRSHCCDNVASKSSRFPWLLFLSQKLMERNQSSA